MAARQYKYTDTDRRRADKVRGQAYVYGNVAAEPAYEPEGCGREHRNRRKASRQVRKNRHKALGMNSGYVMFLAFAAMLALAVCVNYVKLQSKITSRSESISELQAELAEMKEENNTRYNFVMDAVNLEEIRQKAQEELGMVYASEDQVIEYASPSADYVKQYENIPEDGVLAQSDRHAD